MRRLLIALFLFASPAWAQNFRGTWNGLYVGTACPATCTATEGHLCYDTDDDLLKSCTADNTWTTISGAGGYATVDDEDGALTQRTVLNFEGAGITCADDTNQTTCTVPAGSFASPGLGIIVDVDGAGTLDNRTLAAGPGIAIANPAGTAGDPTISIDTATTPQYTSGAGSPPATCSTGQVYAETDQLRACVCSTTDTWTCNGKLRAHATDCTALTDGIADEMCFERDANTTYVCEPSAGGCDTAGEWTAVSGGSGAPTTSKYIVAEADGGLSAEIAPAAADSVPVSDSTSAATWQALPDCDDSAGNHLNYDTGTNAFTCGTTGDGGGTTVADDTILNFGTTVGDTRPGIVWNTVQTADTGMLLTGSTSNHFVIAERSDDAFDFAHAAATDPTLFIHSHNQNTGQWLGFRHDGSFGYMTSGTGAFMFTNSNSNNMLYFSDTGGSAALIIPANYSFGFTSASNDATGTIDTKIQRRSAGVVYLGDATASSVRGLMGGGAAVASATALPLPTGRIFHVTGTTTITSITSTNFEAGVVVTLIFDDVLTFTDGSNLVLAGNFVTTTSDTITLGYDGTNWYEMSRSIN